MAKRWLGWWAALLVCWMAFAGDVSSAEWIFGALGAAASATFALYHRPFSPRSGTSKQPRSPERRLARRVARAPLGLAHLAWTVASDTAVLFVALCRVGASGCQPGSSWRELPIRAERAGPYGPLAGVLCHSLGPNRIVVDWEEGSEVVVVHELVRRPA